jgi:hypothetical protein
LLFPLGLVLLVESSEEVSTVGSTISRMKASSGLMIIEMKNQPTPLRFILLAMPPMRAENKKRMKSRTIAATSLRSIESEEREGV